MKRGDDPVEILDLTDASPEEIIDLKETLKMIWEMAWKQAENAIDKRALVLCLHTHLEAALRASQLEDPCDMCILDDGPIEETRNEKKDMH